MRVLRRFAASAYFKPAMAVLSVLCVAPSDCGGGGGGGLSFENYVVPAPTGQSLTVADVQAIVDNAQNAANSARHAGDHRGGRPRRQRARHRQDGGRSARSDRGGDLPSRLRAVRDDLVRNLGERPRNHCRAERARGAIEGDHCGLSVVGRQRVLDPHREPDHPAGLSAVHPSGRHGRAAVRRAVQPIGLLRPDQFGDDRAEHGGGGGEPGARLGPHFAPIGLSADPGGLPLYKNGVLVGGIGVMTSPNYSVNPNPPPFAANPDEAIALAGSGGFGAPLPIQGPNIIVGGVALDYLGNSTAPPITAPLPPFAGAINVGQSYGAFPNGGDPTSFSGIIPDALATDPVYIALFPNVSAFVLADAVGHNRFDPFDAANAAKSPDDGNAMTPVEAQALVGNALSVATVTRAGIRIPTNSNAQITVSVVDLDGNILGIARTPDAPIFGIDVSLQKARSAVFFTRQDAASAFNTINAITAPPATTPPTPTPAGGFPAYMAATSVQSVFFNGGRWPMPRSSAAARRSPTAPSATSRGRSFRTVRTAIPTGP